MPRPPAKSGRAAGSGEVAIVSESGAKSSETPPNDAADVRAPLEQVP